MPIFKLFSLAHVVHLLISTVPNYFSFHWMISTAPITSANPHLPLILPSSTWAVGELTEILYYICSTKGFRAGTITWWVGDQCPLINKTVSAEEANLGLLQVGPEIMPLTGPVYPAPWQNHARASTFSIVSILTDCFSPLLKLIVQLAITPTWLC